MKLLVTAAFTEPSGSDKAPEGKDEGLATTMIETVVPDCASRLLVDVE